jgi:hypothetical protein
LLRKNINNKCDFKKKKGSYRVEIVIDTYGSLGANFLSRNVKGRLDYQSRLTNEHVNTFFPLQSLTYVMNNDTQL